MVMQQIVVHLLWLYLLVDFFEHSIMHTDLLLSIKEEELFIVVIVVIVVGITIEPQIMWVEVILCYQTLNKIYCNIKDLFKFQSPSDCSDSSSWMF